VQGYSRVNKNEKIQKILLSKASSVACTHLYCSRAETAVARTHYMSTGSGKDAIQAFVQKFPFIYSRLKIFLKPSWSWHSWKKHLPSPSENIVVNLGAGTAILDPEIINVDFVSFPHVDILADFSSDLPIREKSVDAAISISVLEHLSDPKKATHQAAKILRPGGIFYVVVPFLYPDHGAPNDYSRWTLSGLKLLLQDSFEIKDSGSLGGPFGVIVLALSHAFARLFCFGSGALYSFLNFSGMAVLAPIKFLDLLLEWLPFNSIFCPAIYVIAVRRGE
jgi:SAM-dependent methyltransferase